MLPLERHLRRFEFGLGGGDHRHGVAEFQTYSERAGSKEVFCGIEAALGFGTMVEIPIPVGLALKIAAIDQDTVGAGTREGRYPTAAWLVRHVEGPTAPRVGVIVPVSAQRSQFEIHRAAGLPKLESDVGGVAAIGHPQALLEAGIAARVSPYRKAIVIFERTEQLKASRTDGAAGELIGAQLVNAVAVAGEHLQLRDHQHALHGRLQGGDEQAVVTAGVRLG